MGARVAGAILVLLAFGPEGVLLVARAGAATAPATVPGDLSPAELSRLVLNIVGQADPQARVEAALSVLRSSSDEGVKALLNVLEIKNNEAAKLAVCQAIAQARSTHPGFAPALLDLLDHKESALREAAAAALADYRDPAVTARLKEQEHQLLEKRFVAVSKQVYALLPTEADRAAQAQRWLKSTLPLERVTVLEIIHDKMTAGTRPSPEILQQIRQMLTDRDDRVRERLVVILRDVRQPEDSSRVQAMLASERAPVIREEIYRALGYLGDPASIATCVTGLNEAEAQTSAEAAAALGRLAARSPGIPSPGTEDAVAALLDRSAQPMDSPLLREQVIEAMARIADPRFLPVFRAHAGAGEKVPAIRQVALRGVGLVGDLQDVDVVLDRLANDADAGVREFAADAMGKVGSRSEHLERLRERLDPKVEPSAAVQTRAWESYKLLFLKVLPPSERELVLDSWPATDPVAVARRIDLLAELEKQLTTSNAEPSRLTRVRELLGEAYLSAGRGADAAGAFTRVLDVLAATDQETAQRVTGKLMEAYLRTPSPEKAILLVLEARPQQVREGLIGRLLEHIRQTGGINRAAAVLLLDKVSQMVPNRFGPEWARKFDEVRAALPPATQPASTRPG